ncbi:MAG TPA: HXXEE domain-containing protein [Candidatus Kapabacteria bacterium]|nr:HXXEE domain-containing protein [Candidatus Kapabacteria bacterium]
MDIFRKHWFDIGGILAVATLVLVYIFSSYLSNYQIIMYLSLTSLFFHQLEEYRIVGTFPGMINRVMFNSDLPDRFPLNTNTSLIINVYIGWTLYLLAAIVGTNGVWLGIASMMVSLGNIIAHTFLFNIKGRTLFNAGLITSWLLFAPCIFIFTIIVVDSKVASSIDYLLGVLLGILINIFGVFKPITILANRDTNYIFKNSQLLKCDRK